MEFKEVYDLADGGADGSEQHLWHRVFVGGEEGEDFFVVLFTEDSNGDDDAGDDVEGEAYGGAVGQLFPFIIVRRFSAVGELAVFATEEDSAKVYFTQTEEE